MNSTRKLLLLSACLAFAAFLAACSKGSGNYADRLAVKGDKAVCIPAQTSIVLSVSVEGPLKKGLLGGAGQRQPIGGAKLEFHCPDNDPMIQFSDGGIVTSDAGGMASIKLNVGATSGERSVICRTVSRFGAIECAFRLVIGVECENTRQEIIAGHTGQEMLKLKITDSKNLPLEGVPVHFSMAAASGCSLSSEYVETDQKGYAGTLIKAGKNSGEVEVMAQLDLPGQDRPHALRFSSVILNPVSIIVAILGGLALFLLGMTMMSEGLQSVAGARLKSILQLFVRNRFTGILVGTVITAMVQSSSATSVMVVGFVNAGLMSLEQAISVIFGSCIGTTLTTQIMAFGLSGVALPAVLVGLIVRLTGKKAATKHWGDVIMGFGLLFFGMDMMSKTLMPLRSSPTFVHVFQTFDCTPVDGYMPFGRVLAAVGIGLVATMIVQSSAATIGVVMALAGSGLINFYTAFPLVLGDNIGTTITANLAAIGTNRKARRAALVNTLIKFSGTIVMLGLIYVRINGEPCFLYLINAMTAGEVLGGRNENIIRHIAMCHTMFNIVTVVILTPFVRQLAWLCEVIIPVTEEENEGTEEAVMLDERLLRTPALALSQIIAELIVMLKRSAKMVDDSYLCLCEGSTRFLANVAKREASINMLNKRITGYTSALAGHNLNDDEIALLPELMHISHDIERIGDLAMNISELAERRSKEQIVLSDSAVKELTDMDNLLQKQFEAVTKALTDADREAAHRAVALEQDINSLHRNLGANHMKRLEKGLCSPKACVLFLDVIGNVERVGDHLLNIAQRVDFILPYIIKVEGVQGSGRPLATQEEEAL